MVEIPEFLEFGEVARLIPVIADSRKEQRVASVFLATFSAVPDLAQALLATLKVRLGKRSVVDTYTEVVFGSHKDSKDRPDGLIIVTTGKNQWKALVEAKIGRASLDDEQVERYLQIARDNKCDAVITISNQFATRPDHGPVLVPKTLTRRVALFHWSWKLILTEAILLQSRDAISDPDQAFILREFVRFLSHESVGVAGFDQMPKEWKDVVTHIKSGGVVRKTSDEAEAIVSAWHQETRDLALRTSQYLATDVAVRLSRAHVGDASKRLKDDCGVLASESELTVAYEIPNAAAPLTVTVGLKTQTIRVGMEVDAPQDKQTSPARVNWLLRQIKNADPANIFVRIHWPSRAADLVCGLAELREDVKGIVADASNPPRSFEVFCVSDDARRFSGRRTFIEEVEKAVPSFYDAIGQHLVRWRPAAPKPVASTAPPEEQATGAKAKIPEDAGSEASKASRPKPGNQHSVLMDIPDFLRKE